MIDYTGNRLNLAIKKNYVKRLYDTLFYCLSTGYPITISLNVPVS